MKAKKKVARTRAATKQRCPVCKKPEFAVSRTEVADDTLEWGVKRIRACEACKHRATTVEVIEQLQKEWSLSHQLVKHFAKMVASALARQKT